MKKNSLQAQETDVLERIEHDAATGVSPAQDIGTALQAEELSDTDPTFADREYAAVQRAQNEWDQAHPGKLNPATGLTGPYRAPVDALPDLDGDDC